MELKENWSLKKEDFLEKSLKEKHERTRERWLALYLIASGITQMEVAKRLGRSRPAIQSWKEKFEKYGPKGLEYQRTGGRERALSKEEEKILVELVAKESPKKVGINQARWTCKLAASYCKKEFEKIISSETCRRLLRESNVTRKRPKKN